ncbi:MAG: hypothetical protein DWQ01_07580 [Planctomycetota bacterium]|nr:MAG: hypothetical protein DWQ01_07580 [Planctomycetota bacterium]
MIPRSLPLFCPLFLLSASPLIAQGGGWDTLRRFNGEGHRDRFGVSIAPVGWLNSDSIPEVAIGAPGFDHSGWSDAGALYLFSADGRRLHRWVGTSAGAEFGSAVDSGNDLNGDGFADFIVGAPGSLGRRGQAFLYSGKDGSELQSWSGQNPGDRFGQVARFVGDWDGDGTSEAIVGESRDFRLVGSLELLGSQILGNQAKEHLTWVDALRAEDMSTSHPLAVLGYPLQKVHGYDQAGSAVWLDASLSPVVLQGTMAGEAFGAAVAVLGDINGDGLPEWAVGAPGSPGPAGNGAGRVDVFDGATHQLLKQWAGSRAGDAFGSSLAAAGDVNGDGFPDLLIGSSSADGGGGTFRLYSGADWTQLWHRDGKGHDTAMGHRLAAIGDVDQNGFKDFLVTAPGLNTGSTPDTGAALHFDFRSFLSAQPTQLSAASGGQVEYLLDFSNWESGGQYWLLFSARGTGPTQVGFLEIPLSDGPLLQMGLSGQSLPYTQQTSGQLDGKAKATALLDAPPQALNFLIGRSLYAAAVVEPPGQAPWQVSEAVEVSILP